MKYHIGINAQLISQTAGYRRAGIHVYISETLRHLPNPAGYKHSIFIGNAPDFMSTVADQLPAEIVSSSWPTTNPIGRIVWEQTAWPWQNRQRKVDLIHSTAFVTPFLNRIPSIVTIFDLSFIHYPERFPAAQRHYLTSQTRRSAQTAERVITISESSKQDVHQFFDVPLNKIDVALPGVDPAYRQIPADQLSAFRKKSHPPEQYILHVGTLQPRKNIPTLIEAFAQISADHPKLQLVLIGGKGWMYDEIFDRIRKLKLTKRVIFPGYIPDEELPLWYAGAAVFAFPSVYEGFGMPIVEAMACGTPVVAANVSAMPEAAGDAALLFDPSDSEALAKQLRNVLENPQQASKMRTVGFTQAQNFSWQYTGEATAATYIQVLNELS